MLKLYHILVAGIICFIILCLLNFIIDFLTYEKQLEELTDDDREIRN